MSTIKLRNEAIKEGVNTYFTGTPCIHGHVDYRWVVSRRCVSCSKIKLKQWKESNTDHVKKYRQEYRKNNIEKEREDSRRSYQKNKKSYCETAKTNRRQKPEKYMLYRAKSRAAKMNVPFNLSVDDIKIPKYCPVLKKELVFGDYDFAPSIDRIVPKSGYVKENIIIISCKANRIKNDSSIEELKEVYDFYSNLLYHSNSQTSDS